MCLYLTHTTPDLLLKYSKEELKRMDILYARLVERRFILLVQANDNQIYAALDDIGALRDI